MSAEVKRLLIEIRGGEQAPAELPRSGMMVLGSSPEKAALCLPGQGVADVHCAIGITKDGSYAIKDLGSEYGTLVNGARVYQTRLNEGDEIIIGSVRLQVIAAQGSPSPAAAAAPSPPPPSPAPAKATPARASKSKVPNIAGYKVHQLLGRGAMGDVYLAVQQSLDREVALKVLSEEHEQDQAFVESFQAEARSAAALNHPNVVTVHDVGEQDGVHYLTMEYMDRGSLEARVGKEGALPWSIVLDTLKDAASGLVYAESRGIVHRDIKPANLMQNHTGVTKIADLGLATSISLEDAPDGDRKLFGTPHFISPEQVKGEKADCRSDLYSLGSTAYRLLTGHTPFEGANTRDILRAKLRGNPVPIRERTSDVPEGLGRIVARLMALEPANRFPSATALLREIENMQAGNDQGADARPARPESSPNLVKFAVLGTLAAVLTGTAVVMLNKDPKRDPADAVVSGDPGSSFSDLSVETEDLATIGDVDGVSGDDDIQEKLFETAAENALLKLAQRDLTPPERRDALRALALEYLGTTAAATATAEATMIDESIKLAKQQAADRDTRVGGMLKALRDAAKLDDPLLHPGNSLHAMRAVEGQDELENDDTFRAERARIEALVISTALRQFAVVREEIDAQHQAGDFELMRTTIVGLLGRCELPAFEEGVPQTVANEIDALAVSLTDLLESLEVLEIEYGRDRAKGDKQVLAQGLNGIGEQLARLDFSAAATRCDSLAANLSSAESKAWNEHLHGRLVSASKAIPLLVDNFSSWRRSKVEDPEDHRGKTLDAISASSEGLVLEDRGDQREVPWSSFGAKTKPLNTLFSKRLSRNYSDQELDSIGALMHLSALAECLAQASEMFTEDGEAVFTPGEAQELPVGFDLAKEWITDPEELQILEMNRKASQILGQALLSGSEGNWTTAVGQLEQLFLDYPNSWVVRVMSDGS